MSRAPFHVVRIPRPFLALSAIVLLCGGLGLWLSPDPPTLSAGARAPAGEARPMAARVGHPAPDFTLADPNGRFYSLSAYEGRPVLLYFWATWCPHCERALPELVALKEAHKDAGLEILAVNILESAEKVQAYQERHNLPFPALLDPDGAVSDTYLVRATPTYALIDRNGVLSHLMVGAPRKGAIEARLRPLLENPKEESGSTAN